MTISWTIFVHERNYCLRQYVASFIAIIGVRNWQTGLLITISNTFMCMCISVSIPVGMCACDPRNVGPRHDENVTVDDNIIVLLTRS